MINTLGSDKKLFYLGTNNTSYIFAVNDTGHLLHLHYGRKISLKSYEDAMLALSEKTVCTPGNTNIYDNEHKNVILECECLEMSSYGKGDDREPMVELTFCDGSRTVDFVFDGFKIANGKKEFKTLPGSYDEDGKVQTLTITLREKNHEGVRLYLSYYVYEECDVITRSARLVNESKNTIVVDRLLSMTLDFHKGDYVFTRFCGAWAREMEKVVTPVSYGKIINSSFTGTSSNKANPFVMLSDADATQDSGNVYGFNLIYSGNHYEAVCGSSFGKTRIAIGINPNDFAFLLNPNTEFEAPEAVMTFAKDGYNSMSQNMHAFVRNHIVRGKWKNKSRPILLNSWEAAYFDIDEKKLLELAKCGKKAGIELFVMDDGWFGNRNDDTSSLGDWNENREKLKGGLKGICDKINALGLMFGIWVEPEMVNVNSKLYEKHADWVIDIPGQDHSEGRNQRILDLTNNEVCDYIIEEMTRVFSSANITYVKWDMNRTFTDYFSKHLTLDRQKEVAHRYVCGLYKCMKTLTERFPDILFEGCSAGGNRFDLGILCYFPQIWGSDNTDASVRFDIQNSYSYGYPLSTVGAHVSGCPNHQTLRNTPIWTRFNIAAYGILGYECNLCDLSAEDVSAVKEQIAIYKEWREVFFRGNFYRSETKNEYLPGKDVSWCVVSPDKSKAVGINFQRLVKPNNPYSNYKAKGLDETKAYRFYNVEHKLNIKEFGDLINTVSPVHIKNDSLLQNVASKFVKIDGEKIDLTAYGDLLMEAGVNLNQAFIATGLNENVRVYQDFASRMYFMEERGDV